MGGVQSQTQREDTKIMKSRFLKSDILGATPAVADAGSSLACEYVHWRARAGGIKKYFISMYSVEGDRVAPKS